MAGALSIPVSTGYRRFIVISIDTFAAAASLLIAFHLRMSGTISETMADGLILSTPLFAIISLAVFHSVGLYRRVWRYVSVADLIIIVEAVTLAIGIFLLTLFLFDRLDWMPRSVPAIQWFVLVVLLGGARMARRIVREWSGGARRSRWPRADAARAVKDNDPRRPALLVGPCDRVEMVLRLLESTPEAGFKAIGILDDEGRHLSLRVRGVPILGPIEALEQIVKQLEASGRRPECVILTESTDRFSGAAMVQLVTRAETLGLEVAHLPKLAEFKRAGAGALDLSFINMADLLGRSQAALDPEILGRALAGRRILITGAGGTIGRELTRQIAALRPSQLVLLDGGEFNLYSIDLELQENYPDVPRTPVLCSIRERQRIMQVFEEHRPELVFHAAALKHVPLVEQHPCAGVLTNVIGTCNVADAARQYGVRAMVQVSTDKAVNPVGIMGATKRLAELYCQALDLEGHGHVDAPRFLTVRFGNVLGSSGSLIPLFERQLSRGGPLTVTHPEIERYFMTVHEAVQLVLQSTARALEGNVRRGRIFVLDMGEPIKIIEIARRMIRLAGLRPDTDVKIDIVGLRPGEKLFEELFDSAEQRLPSAIPGIFEAVPSPIALSVLNHAFGQLAAAGIRGDAAEVKSLIAELLSSPREPEVVQFQFAKAQKAQPAGIALQAG